jgi:hypothetical protein
MQDERGFDDVNPAALRQFTWGGALGSLLVETDAFVGTLADLKN